MYRHLFIALILTGGSLASPVLDLLERQRDVEHVNPNVNSDRPALSPEQIEENRVQVIALAEKWSGSALDGIWAHATVFNNPTNAIIQSLAFTGVFHAQGGWGEVESPRDRENLKETGTRRLRLGARLKTFYKTEIEAIVDLDNDDEAEDLYSLKVKYKATGRDTLTFGKYRTNFGLEGSGSAQDLLTVDRSLLGSYLLPARTLGMSLKHEFDTWSATVGYFSGNRANGISGGSGNNFLSLNFEGVLPDAEVLNVKNTWHLDYIYNFDRRESEAIPQRRYSDSITSFTNGAPLQNPLFQHMLAVGMKYQEGRFGFHSDAFLAQGDSAVWGVTLQPTYWAVPGTLQLVGRFHYARATDAGGLVQNFGIDADSVLGSGPFATGDEFYSLYMGANLHIYQDRLKILSGVEYSRLTETDGEDETEALLFQTAARLASIRRTGIMKASD